jgi:hypothetical protein
MHIPPEIDLKQRQNALLTAAKKRLESELDAFWLDVHTAIDERLERRDFDGAAEWLKSEFPAELERRTGYAQPSELPSTRMLRDTRALDDFSQKIAERRRAARESAREHLAEHVTTNVLRDVEHELEASHWQTASTMLDEAVPAWLAANAEQVAGLNEQERAVVGESVSPRLEEVRARIRDEVSRASAGLEAELPVMLEELHEELRTGGRDVGTQLQDAFRASLERRRIDLAEIPDRALFPALARFETAVGELEAAERAQVERDALLGFEEAETEAIDLMHARHYADAAAFWRSKLEQSYLEPERARIELRVRECEMLQGLLETVTAAVRELDGREWILYNSSTISERGTIDAGPDPLGRGFELVDGARRHRYRIDRASDASADDTTLTRIDLEILAKLTPRADLEGHFLQALLRYHEGEFKAAAEVFPSAHGSNDPLYVDLGERIDEASRAQSAEAAERREQLDFQLRQITRFSEKGEDRDALKEINRTLERFQDLLAEGEAKWLRAKQELLMHRGAPPTLQQAYAPDRLAREVQPRSFSMSWDFDAEEKFAWKRGNWKCDGQGWYSPRQLGSDDELFEAGSAPELLLVPPIDLTEELRLHLVLERFDAEVETQTLVLSFAGFHLAVLVDGTRGSWLLDVTSPRDVLDRLRAAPTKAGSFKPVPASVAFPLEITVNPKLVCVRSLEIGGTRLTPPTFARRELGDPRIELRARERILLLKAELTGKEQER